MHNRSKQTDHKEFKIITIPAERWKEYKELRLRALNSDPQAFGSSYNETLNSPDSKWKKRLIESGKGKNWIAFAEKKGDLIGMAGAYRKKLNEVRVVGVYIDKSERGKRVGSSLLSELIKRIRTDNNKGALILQVNEKQIAAVQLYKKMGFKVYSKKKEKLGDGKVHAEVIMKMEI